MTEANTALQEPPGREPPRFSAVLTPHRSLGPKGFMVLMAAVYLLFVRLFRVPLPVGALF